MTERTFFMIKPDAVRRRLWGAVIQSIVENVDKVQRLHLRRVTREQAETLYSEHRGKHFFDELIEFTVSGPVVVGIFEAPDAVARGRRPVDWIRSDTRDPDARACENMIHASDSLEAASREIGLFFP